MATTFILARNGSAQIGTGSAAGFTSVDAARQALSDGSVPAVTGALGFDTSGLAALTAPAEWAPAATAPPARAPRPATAQTIAETTPEEHRDRVERALKVIDEGTVDKVVLARTAELLLDGAVDPADLVSSFLHVGREATAFGVSLTPAGRDGHWLIGASPELLIRKQGNVVTAHPYAGSAPRLADPDADAATSRRLMESPKDRSEHAFVVNYLRTRLAPLCTELDAPAEPSLESTGELWHLATPIRGILADDSVTALDLAALLSPTPAVCGTPTAAAADLISELEGPRDFYAGTVGWCDANGDGEWLVSIRCPGTGRRPPHGHHVGRRRHRRRIGSGRRGGRDGHQVPHRPPRTGSGLTLTPTASPCRLPPAVKKWRPAAVRGQIAPGTPLLAISVRAAYRRRVSRAPDPGRGSGRRCLRDRRTGGPSSR
ncbi:isochorismate synthase [Gordonia sp. (in: high G+C Gram-positive bacteria)]|uniref:isochorismate synthase n=1 Tax=Gordonia sp. (in: high G+C Gram-positive bacteria) TaxID=84139 RepID=UPI0039E3D16D